MIFYLYQLLQHYPTHFFLIIYLDEMEENFSFLWNQIKNIYNKKGGGYLKKLDLIPS